MAHPLPIGQIPSHTALRQGLLPSLASAPLKLLADLLREATQSGPLPITEDSGLLMPLCKPLTSTVASSI